MVTDDLGLLLGDAALDAVVVATSVPTHYGTRQAGLEAGKHAFIEKPIALKAADAARPAGPRRKPGGLKLMVGHLLESITPPCAR